MSPVAPIADRSVTVPFGSSIDVTCCGVGVVLPTGGTGVGAEGTGQFSVDVSGIATPLGRPLMGHESRGSLNALHAASTLSLAKKRQSGAGLGGMGSRMSLLKGREKSDKTSYGGSSIPEPVCKGIAKLKFSKRFETEVQVVKFSSDDEYIAVGLGDGKINILHAKSTLLVQSLVPPTETSTVPSLPGAKSASTSNPLLASLESISYPCTSLAWRFDGSKGGENWTRNVLVAGYADGRFLHWHATTGVLLASKRTAESDTFGPTGSSPITSVDSSRDGSYSACVGDECVVRLWDEMENRWKGLLKGGNNPELQGPTSRSFVVRIHPHTFTTLLTAGWDNTIQLWDTRVGSAVSRIYGPYTCGESVDWDEAGQRIVSGSWRKENQVQIWDYPSGNKVETVKWSLFPDAAAKSTMIYTAGFSHPVNFEGTMTPSTVRFTRDGPGQAYSVFSGQSTSGEPRELVKDVHLPDGTATSRLFFAAGNGAHAGPAPKSQGAGSRNDLSQTTTERSPNPGSNGNGSNAAAAPPGGEAKIFGQTVFGPRCVAHITGVPSSVYSMGISYSERLAALGGSGNILYVFDLATTGDPRDLEFFFCIDLRRGVLFLAVLGTLSHGLSAFNLLALSAHHHALNGMFFLSAMGVVVCVAGIKGVLKNSPRHLRLFSIYYWFDLIASFLFTVFLSIAAPGMKDKICDAVREHPQEGFGYDECMENYPLIMATAVTTLWVGVIVRLHLTLAVHSLYNRLVREQADMTRGVVYLAVPFNYEPATSVDEEALPGYPGTSESQSLLQKH
ncbi:WD40 repeat-like protein [Gonapodya prolifera JEL478]|uniref:WD40 repeat-like protein n=1 Tax=Gonapodya prolifera (strain JEL478) TaxID=1344416 RepID=A0A139AIV4_GONPJ|nr:WD40 repeat-like protein [Gonapodya prolifera JEL478]|eukprot:KXS16732.1 WD40 repeat-like protein [Gonapodya prolifera JEL478]